MTREQINTFALMLSKQQPEDIKRIVYMPNQTDNILLQTTTADFRIKPDGTATMRTETEIRL